MAQARTDFAARLATGRVDDTVSLLVVIAYRRALKVLRSERTRPPTTSIETMFHLPDEETPTPEQETIDRDRQERVVKAMGHLPERERKLMALVYFENMSIRAAGRQLGWGKSVANRHHQAALERLKAMLDRSLLSPEIAIPAFVANRHQSLPRAARLWIEGAAETIRDAALLGGGRIGPLADRQCRLAQRRRTHGGRRLRRDGARLPRRRRRRRGGTRARGAPPRRRTARRAGGACSRERCGRPRPRAGRRSARRAIRRTRRAGSGRGSASGSRTRPLAEGDSRV
jgi:RNA polymerase sigma factor (sigma-70 family)